MIKSNEQFKKLEEIIKKNYSQDDQEMVRLAYDFAQSAHQDQKRMSGDPYIVHPLATAQKLAELNLDIETIISGLLHDVPEDTEVTMEEIEKNFGSGIAKLVTGITKLGTIKYRGIERYAENLRKMFVAMSDDIRVIFIKFADRLHNLKTLDVLSEDKRIRIATETLEIYGPIADRLGMGKIKGELEDLAFPYVYPEDYKWLKDLVPKKYKQKEKYLEKIKRAVVKELIKRNINLNLISIHGRTKHFYSLYKKLNRPHINRDLAKVYDLLALRIIVPTIEDCYSTLGIVHKLYKPLPNTIKDYIAQPKSNGYQSLHTTILTTEKKIVEFQIRTLKMHNQAEFGIAAHWNYKEKNGSLNKNTINWIKEILNWQKQIKDSASFINDIKVDFFKDRIFVLTPEGDAIDLPENSTPIDFAYHVHSLVGDKCVGARVNNHMVSLDFKLNSGDVVEIITDKNRMGPSPNWLDTAKTSMAKNRIKSALNKIKKKNK